MNQSWDFFFFPPGEHWFFFFSSSVWVIALLPIHVEESIITIPSQWRKESEWECNIMQRHSTKTSSGIDYPQSRSIIKTESPSCVFRCCCTEICWFTSKSSKTFESQKFLTIWKRTTARVSPPTRFLLKKRHRPQWDFFSLVTCKRKKENSVSSSVQT